MNSSQLPLFNLIFYFFIFKKTFYTNNILRHLSTAWFLFLFYLVSFLQISRERLSACELVREKPPLKTARRVCAKHFSRAKQTLGLQKDHETLTPFGETAVSLNFQANYPLKFAPVEWRINHLTVKTENVRMFSAVLLCNSLPASPFGRGEKGVYPSLLCLTRHNPLLQNQSHCPEINKKIKILEIIHVLFRNSIHGTHL